MATVKVRPRQPNGYPMLCSVCGPIGSGEEREVARRIAIEHQEWHKGQGK